MTTLTAKHKIYFSLAIWAGLLLLMHFYLFKILDNSNQSLVNSYANQQHNLAILKAEQASYIQAKADLDQVKRQKYQPGDLFSKDTSLVNELRLLESMAEKYNVALTISGVQGTLKTAPKAKTTSEIFVVPYALSLEGLFEDTMKYVENLEHIKFITTVNSVSVRALTGDKVVVSLNANFYLKK